MLPVLNWSTCQKEPRGVANTNLAMLCHSLVEVSDYISVVRTLFFSRIVIDFNVISRLKQ